MSKPRNGKRKTANKKTTAQLAEIRQRATWQRSADSMLGPKARVDERPQRPSDENQRVEKLALHYNLTAVQQEVEELLRVLPRKDKFVVVTRSYLKLLKHRDSK